MPPNSKLLSACACALSTLLLASCSASSASKDVKPATPASTVVAVSKVETADLTRAMVASGRQLHYRADPACPLFPELRSIATKTWGVRGRIGAALDGRRDFVGATGEQ